MSAMGLVRSLNREQRNTFLASFLGWTQDAFDFFLVTFVVLRISTDFRVSTVAVAFAITLTLLMRPIGVLLFGMLAERSDVRQGTLNSQQEVKLSQFLQKQQEIKESEHLLNLHGT